MNLQGVSFLSSNIPILLGAIILLFLLKVNPLSPKHILVHENLNHIKDPYLSEENNLDDLLIINGVRKADMSNSKFVWFDKLSLSDTKCKLPKSIILITKNDLKTELSKLAYSNSPNFGLLVPYMFDSGLSGVQV